MYRLLKKFCVWLLAVALLGQGIAVMASTSCSPKSARPTVEHVLTGNLGTMHSEQAALAPPDAHADTIPSSGSKCSKCVAGCVGAVLPIAEAAWEPTLFVARVDNAPAYSSYTDYLPATPERPPRARRS